MGGAESPFTPPCSLLPPAAALWLLWAVARSYIYVLRVLVLCSNFLSPTPTSYNSDAIEPAAKEEDEEEAGCCRDARSMSRSSAAVRPLRFLRFRARDVPEETGAEIRCSIGPSSDGEEAAALGLEGTSTLVMSSPFAIAKGRLNIGPIALGGSLQSKESKFRSRWCRLLERISSPAPTER